jgi:integrase
MKTELSQDLVLRLNVAQKPSGLDPKGRLIFEDNPEQKEWILYDTHRKAPIGFGVKVAKGKTYIIQRKIDGRPLKIRVGNISDFEKIDAAREAARLLADEAKKTGTNPNITRRQRRASEITLDQAFDDYVAYLTGKSTPAKQNTLDNIQKSRNKIAALLPKRIPSLTSTEITALFDDLAPTARTSTEQAFRWASAATKHAIKLEAHNAGAAGREPTLKNNPFNILSLQDKYRSRAQLAEEYKEKGVRNPLSARDTLGAFLEALWSHRGPLNNTGCDYLLLMLLWGCRKSEHAELCWRELLTDEEARTASWVDLKKGKLRFHDTKNRRSHELPLTRAAKEILKRRQETAAEQAETTGYGKNRKWVFPARSRFSKTGHYTDAQSLIKNIATDAGIPRLTRHDLRRSFGRLADELALPQTVIMRLLNHVGEGVTALYTEAEFGRVRDYLQRIEDAVLATSPSVYNAYRPLGSPPMPENKKETACPQPKPETTQKRRRRASS